MAFTVEDGTGKADSNAYISTSFADTYHADRGRTDWGSASTPDKQTAIVRATDYIEKRFGRRFRGERQTKAQALEWPRLDALDNDGFLLNDTDDIPRALQKACAEYALVALRIGELAPRPALPGRQEALDGTETQSEGALGPVKSKREKVGPIEEQTTYAEGATQNTASKSSLVAGYNLPEYPAADLLIEELLRAQGSKKIARA